MRLFSRLLVQDATSVVIVSNKHHCKFIILKSYCVNNIVLTHVGKCINFMFVYSKTSIMQVCIHGQALTQTKY